MDGWRCPGCGRCYGPFVSMCGFCPGTTVTTTTTTAGGWFCPDCRWSTAGACPKHPQQVLSPEAAALLAQGLQDAAEGRVSPVPDDAIDDGPDCMNGEHVGSCRHAGEPITSIGSEGK